jgi:hypothetical protein
MIANAEVGGGHEVTEGAPETPHGFWNERSKAKWKNVLTQIDSVPCQLNSK